MKNAVELAEMIRTADTWDMDILEEFCTLAGLEEEWKNADGDSFESVVYKAAEILEVEIF